MIRESYMELLDSPIAMAAFAGDQQARREFNRRYVRPIDLRLQRWRRHPRRWPLTRILALMTVNLFGRFGMSDREVLLLHDNPRRNEILAELRAKVQAQARAELGFAEDGSEDGELGSAAEASFSRGHGRLRDRIDAAAHPLLVCYDWGYAAILQHVAVHWTDRRIHRHRTRRLHRVRGHDAQRAGGYDRQASP